MIKFLQINALDLFVFLDFQLTTPVAQLSEFEWQNLTYSNKKNKPLSKLYGLVEMINRENPDVILLNEVGGKESLENFNHLFLNNSYKVAMTKGTSDRGIDNGFLVKSHINFKIDGISHVKIGNDSIKYNRAVNHLTLLLNDFSLNIFGVHLKSQRGNPNDYESIISRYNEVKGLVEILKTYESTNQSYILAGDFNAKAAGEDKDMEFLQIYENLSLKDIHEIKNTNPEKRFSYIMFDHKNSPIFSQIDYIMLSKNLQNKLKQASNSYYMYNGELTYAHRIELKEKLASDHYPQIAILDIKN